MAARKKTKVPPHARRGSNRALQLILTDRLVVEEVTWWSGASLIDVSVNVFTKRIMIDVLVGYSDDQRLLPFEAVFTQPFEDFFLERNFEALRQRTRMGRERFQRVLVDAVAKATRPDRLRLFEALVEEFEIPESEASIKKPARLWAVRRLLEQFGEDMDETALVQIHRAAWIGSDVMNN